MKIVETVETNERENSIKEAKKKRSKEDKLRRGWLKSSKTIQRPGKGSGFKD